MKMIPPVERRPGFAAFALEVSNVLQAAGKGHVDALSTAKGLYTNGTLAMRTSRSRLTYIDNPHLGGKCVELLPETLKAYK